MSLLAPEKSLARGLAWAFITAAVVCVLLPIALTYVLIIGALRRAFGAVLPEGLLQRTRKGYNFLSTPVHTGMWTLLYYRLHKGLYHLLDTPWVEPWMGVDLPGIGTEPENKTMKNLHPQSSCHRSSKALSAVALMTLLLGLPAGACGGSDGEASGESPGDGGVRGDGDPAGNGAQSSGGSTGGGSTGEPPIIEGDCTIFPADNPWNLDISELPVHENSDNFIESVGTDSTMHPDFGTVWDGAPIGIPYVIVDASQADIGMNYTAYGDESTPGPFPLPLDAPIEGGASSDGDRHAIAVDTEACMLYELYRAFPRLGQWDADSGVAWDLSTNAKHPEGCTSADAAGLPIFPGLVRYDEVVEQGEIRHALRFTVAQSQRAYIHPATHYASSNTDPNTPPMGLRFRMKASYDCSSYSAEVQVICAALKTYGMIMADNGSNWYLSGAPDERWNDDNLRDIKSIPGNAFEVVDTGDPIVTDAPDCSL